MGVKGFAAWLAAEYPDAFAWPASSSSSTPPPSTAFAARRSASWGGFSGGAAAAAQRDASSSARRGPATPPDRFAHVYVDLAGLLHTALRNAKNADHFIMLVFTKLDSVVRTTRPTRSLVLALDGPAPLAKLLTQRSRRRRAGRKEAKAEASVAGDDDDEADSGSSESDGGPASTTTAAALSSLSLTPGTALMARLDAALAYWAVSRVGRPPWKGGVPAVEVSGGRVPGEGELKLLARLLCPGGAVPARHGDTHCVVGGDSDLLLMAMGVPADDGSRAVWVLTEDGRGSGGKRSRLVQPPPGVVGGAPLFFSVGGLDAALARALGPGKSGGGGPRSAVAVAAAAAAAPPPPQPAPLTRPPPPPSATASARRDLAALAILTSGNDYLPPVRRLRLGQAWRAYLSAVRPGSGALAGRTLVVDGRPGSGRAGSPPSIGLDVDVLLAVLGACMGWKAGGFEAAAPAPTPSPDAPPPSDNDDEPRPPADAAAYLSGLAWVLGMYATGACADFRFAYDARGPSADALAAALVAGSDGRRVWWPPAPLLARPALAPALCAAALLPAGARGRRHAPPALRPLWDVGSPVADLYAVCDDCEALADAACDANAAYNAAAADLRSATTAAGGGGSRLPSPTTTPALEPSALAALEARVESTRDAVRAVSAAQRAHQRSVHPYTPFPLDRLEAAVTDALEAASAGSGASSADDDGERGADARLLAFDEPRLYRRRVARKPPPGAPPQPPPTPPSSTAASLPTPPCDRLPALDAALAREVLVGPAGGGGGRAPAVRAPRRPPRPPPPPPRAAAAAAFKSRPPMRCGLRAALL